jgi:hypothetical protein
VLDNAAFSATSARAMQAGSSRRTAIPGTLPSQLEGDGGTIPSAVFGLSPWMRLRLSYALFIGRQGWRCRRCQTALEVGSFLVRDEWQLALDGTPQHFCPPTPGGRLNGLGSLDAGVGEITGTPFRRRFVRAKLRLAKACFRVLVRVRRHRRHRRRSELGPTDWRSLAPPEV